MIFNITPEFITDFFEIANGLFQDMLPLLLVCVGFQLGFFILSRASGLFGNWGVGRKYGSYEAETDRWFYEEEDEFEE